MELAVFVIFAGLALASALVVVTHRNPVYSTMSLVVTLVSLAVLFVVLGAPFIGVLQVLIYTGAIVVLFLFVIMLLNIGREEGARGGRVSKGIAAIAATIFAGMLGLFSWRAFSGDSLGEISEELVSLRGLATELFERYLLTFELVGLLLLVAVIAATVLARKPDQSDKTEASSGGGTRGTGGERTP